MNPERVHLSLATSDDARLNPVHTVSQQFPVMDNSPAHTTRAWTAAYAVRPLPTLEH